MPDLTLDFYLYMAPRCLNSGSCTAMVISPEPSPQLQYLLLECECFAESKHSSHNCEIFTFTLLSQKESMKTYNHLGKVGRSDNFVDMIYSHFTHSLMTHILFNFWLNDSHLQCKEKVPFTLESNIS